jgi:two-component system, sensor histidine kinase PdtaS
VPTPSWNALTMMPRVARPARAGADADADRRIASNLALVADVLRQYSGALAAQGQTMTVRDISIVMGGIAARVDTLARLHRDLAAEPGATEINLSACLRSICVDYAKSLPPPGRIVLSHQLARDCLVPVEQALPLALITCEVVCNAVRHAHPADVVGFINVCCWHDTTGDLVLDVADDGVGLPPGFDPVTDSGFGLRLVRQLCEQLGGTCTFDDSGLGLHFRLCIPSGTAEAAAPIPAAAGARP